MAVLMRPLEQSAARWGRGMLRHGVKTLRDTGSVATPQTVLWMVAPCLRIINYRSKQTAAITIPWFVLTQLGAQHGDYLEFLPGPNGQVLLRKARARKVRNAYKRFAWVEVALRAGRRRVGEERKSG